MNFSKFGIMTAKEITNYCEQFHTILNNFNKVVGLWLITGDGNRLEFIPNKRVFTVTKSDYKWFWMTKICFSDFDMTSVKWRWILVSLVQWLQ